MHPFAYAAARSLETVRDAFKNARTGPASASASQILAGGTTLVDLMKLDVMSPDLVVDINGLKDLNSVEEAGAVIRLGALAKMADVARHPVIVRDLPLLSESLALAASPQLRNMATLGGNVLQRTRCTYFRDVSWAACNKRSPGSGCAALDGFNRSHAILGVSDRCIATYPGDFAQALIALDATVETQRRSGRRAFPFSQLHTSPGDAPDRETTLDPGEVITGFAIRREPWMRRSCYIKARDRQSYEFALASAAVALDLAPDRIVRQARIAVGGVATKPWRADVAERALENKPMSTEAARRAAELAFAGAQPQKHNAFKAALGRRVVEQALSVAAAMEMRG